MSLVYVSLWYDSDMIAEWQKHTFLRITTKETLVAIWTAAGQTTQGSVSPAAVVWCVSVCS